MTRRERMAYELGAQQPKPQAYHGVIEPVRSIERVIEEYKPPKTREGFEAFWATARVTYGGGA